MQNEQAISLRLGTYNIRNITDHYEKRLPLLKKTVDLMKCDIIGLQEVSFDEKIKNQIKDINHNDSYIPFYGESQLKIGEVHGKEDPCFNIDGNSILLNKNIISNFSEQEKDSFMKLQETLVLHISATRVVHMVKFHVSKNGFTTKINFVNVHLHHTIDDENVRLYQTKTIINWIHKKTNPKEEVNVIVGDFNATPESETYNLITKNGYTSLFSKFNGVEPEKTFHNKMDAPFKDTDPDGTFDYIL